MIGGNIHKLRKRSNDFVQNLNLHVATVIESSSSTIVKLNQKQLKESKLTTGQSITPLYSDAYAKRKGTRKPDGFLSGEMYSEMDVFVNEPSNDWFVTSFADHAKFFVDRYKKVFGLTKENQKQAQKVTIPKMRALYNKLVLQ